MIENIANQGIRLQSDVTKHRIERTDRRIENTQTLWEDYKKDIAKLAKETTKECYHKITSRIKAIEKDIKETNNNPKINTNNNLRAHEAFLTSQLKQLKKKEATTHKATLNAKLANHSEKLGGIWSALGKEKRPRNPIYRLRIPNSDPLRYKHHSRRMAELACKHHDTLQNEDIDPNISPNEYARKLDDILKEIPDNQCLQEPDRSQLNWKITEDQVSRALHLTRDGSATGLDGCPYELWKALEKRHNRLRHRNKPSFDIIKTLTHLFQDIQEHGVDDRMEFTMGWMCPLFKKKDPTDI